MLCDPLIVFIGTRASCWYSVLVHLYYPLCRRCDYMYNKYARPVMQVTLINRVAVSTYSRADSGHARAPCYFICVNKPISSRRECESNMQWPLSVRHIACARTFLPPKTHRSRSLYKRTGTPGVILRLLNGWKAWQSTL